MDVLVSFIWPNILVKKKYENGSGTIMTSTMLGVSPGQSCVSETGRVLLYGKCIIINVVISSLGPRIIHFFALNIPLVNTLLREKQLQIGRPYTLLYNVPISNF